MKKQKIDKQKQIIQKAECKKKGERGKNRERKKRIIASSERKQHNRQFENIHDG